MFYQTENGLSDFIRTYNPYTLESITICNSHWNFHFSEIRSKVIILIERIPTFKKKMYEIVNLIDIVIS